MNLTMTSSQKLKPNREWMLVQDRGERKKVGLIDVFVNMTQVLIELKTNYI